MYQKIVEAIKPPKAKPCTLPQDVIDRQYKHWRLRIMYGTMIGYAVYYFCRKNMSMANMHIRNEFGLSNTDMGMILGAATIFYAFSKFLSGVLADRMNATVLMAFGLVVSALMNILFGLSPVFSATLGMATPLVFFIVFWAISNLFQGLGMPPCSKMLTSWYSAGERGTAWGIWNASHQSGSAIIMITLGFVIPIYGWRAAFFGPAIFALLISLFILNRLRDTPESIGLPSVEEHKGGEAKCAPKEQLPFKEAFSKYILRNKMVWIVCFANFFVYIVRIGVLDWGPTFLQESKGFTAEASGFATSAFEVAGMTGAFVAGLLSDKLMKGRRGPVSVVFMAMLIGAIFMLLSVPAGHPWITSAILIMAGFFVYGPQMLVAVAAADFATREAAATAVGLTGFFGYIGATVCGIGTGMAVDKFGWNGGFWFWVISAVIGTVLFLFTWSKRPEVAAK